MSPRPPKIDPRTYADLVQQTAALAQRFSDWQPPPEGQTDAGRALIRIFGRMAAMVTDRLNRVPDKHFLAFLNLIGAQQQPPRAARVPLTAYLVDDSPVDALLPAHTQVAALPQDGDTEEVLFETEQDLVVMRSQLQAAIVHRGQQYCEHISTILEAHGTIPVFEIEKPTTVLITTDPLTPQFDSPIYLEVNTPDVNPAEQPHTWKWSYWDGETWRPLRCKVVSSVLEAGTERLKLKPRTGTPNPAQSKTIGDVEALWLKGIAPRHLPEILTVAFVLPESDSKGIRPDQAFFNTEEIDLTQDFFPVGETPQFNDTFYIASRALFSTGKATVNINLTITDNYPIQKPDSNSLKNRMPYPKDVAYKWEVWNGETWVGERIARHTAVVGTHSVDVQLPANPAPVEVNGETNYWMRSRLIAGNYGSEPSFESVKKSVNNEVKFVLQQDVSTGYFPPVLKSITLSRSEIKVEPKAILKALPSEALIRSTKGFRLPGVLDEAPTVAAFYLRFNQPFPNQSIALYLQVAPPEPGALRASEPVTEPAKLRWEYSTADSWRPLSVIDGTQTLSQRGMVQFIGPTDLAARTFFGQSGYWLRLCWHRGQFQITPRLQRVLTNTVWATQAITQQDEILGSGTGDPGLVLRTLQTPVLPGQQLVVREPELPPTDEQAAIKQLEGEDAITITTDEAGQPEEIWVRWHAVSDFYGSSSRDRHYTLDRMTGEIRFGGEGQGLPPPLGRNNIRMARYQSGGGQLGNREAETLTELRTTAPYVDRVTNHEPANGGADVESIAAVQESGPKQLRHRDRAVTWQDIEDLTYAASSEIARVKVITPRFDPLTDWIDPKSEADAARAQFNSRTVTDQGQVKILIVPHGWVRQPTPSLALIDQIKRYLGERISPTLTLQVTEPPWVQVTVTAEIAPISLEAANGLASVVDAKLTAFLHPLTGGPRKRGWPFGRQPHKSDLYALLERIVGVSHVKSLEVATSPSLSEEDRYRFLIYSGQHTITIAPPE